MPISPRPPSARNTSSSPPAPAAGMSRLLLAHASSSFAASVTSPKDEAELAAVGVVEQQRTRVVETGEVPETGPSAALTVSASPRAPARVEPSRAHAARSPSPSSHILSQSFIVCARKHNASRGESDNPWRARNVAVRPRSTGAETRLSPIPITATVPGARRPRGAFNENAARLRRTDENVVRPLEAQRRVAPPARRIASMAATPATSASCPRFGWRAVERSDETGEQVAGHRRPGAARAAAPGRSAGRAMTHSGPRSPARTRRMASALVPSTSSRSRSVQPSGKSAGLSVIGRRRRSQLQRARRGERCVDERRRDEHEQQHEGTRQRHDEARHRARPAGSSPCASSKNMILTTRR